jgi:O-antigen/teichoic acid export membrane protein
MGIIIRQSFKGAFIGYLGAFLGGIMTIFIYPYFLNPELIGLTRILFDFALLFAFLSQFGITNAIVKFYPYFEEGKKRKKFLKLIVLFPFIGFLIVASIILCFKSSVIGMYSQNSSLFTQYFYFIFPFALIIIYLNVFETYSTTLHRIAIPKLIRDVVVRILILASILAFAFYHLKVEIFVSLFILTYLVAVIANVLYSFKLTKFEETVHRGLVSDNKMYKNIIVYMFFVFLAGIGTNMIMKTDTLMISSMLGLEKTGIYSISFFIATIVEIPSKTTLMISGASISRDLVLSDIKKVENFYKKNTLNQSIIGGLLLILIWINIHNIFKIMPSGKLYEDGKYVIIFITLAKFYDSVTGINNQIIIYSKYYKMIIIYTFIMAIIIIAGNYFLIPILGITGAAISCFVGYFFINTISIAFIYFKLGIHPYKKQLLIILILYLICFIINYITPNIGNPYLDTLFRSTIITAIYTVFILRSKISPELSQLFMNLLNFKSFINFLKGKQ